MSASTRAPQAARAAASRSVNWRSAARPRSASVAFFEAAAPSCTDTPWMRFRATSWARSTLRSLASARSSTSRSLAS